MGHDPRLRAQAEQALQHVLAVGPDNPRMTAGTLTSLGFIRIEEQRWNEARALMLQAIDADPGYTLAHQNLSLLLVREGDAAGARTAAESALATATEPEDVANARLQLARLLEGSDDPADRARAVEHYRALLEAYPADPAGVRPRLDALLAAPGAAPEDAPAVAPEDAPPGAPPATAPPKEP
jgi:tetratricopeptide (TPR) repeat protein